jgi:hypothetical protein
MSLPRALIAVAEDRPAETPEPALGSEAQTVDLAAAGGRYDSPDGRKLTVRVEGRQVSLSVDDGPTYQLFPTGWDRLYAPGLDASVSFAELGDGTYRSLRWDSVFETFVAPRAGGG